MKPIRIAALAAALLGGAMLAPVADAHGHGYYRYGHGGYRSSVGIYVGVPGPYYYGGYYGYPYYPRAYYYPGYYYPPAPAYYPPATYIEQSAPAAAPAPPSSGGYWYYCRDSQTYYPYVQQCASQWQQVLPNSGPHS